MQVDAGDSNMQDYDRARDPETEDETHCNEKVNQASSFATSLLGDGGQYKKCLTPTEIIVTQAAEQHAEDETTLGSSGRMTYRLDGEACATTVTTPDNTSNHNGHNGRSEMGTLFDLIDLPSPEDLEGNGFALRVNGRI